MQGVCAMIKIKYFSKDYPRLKKLRQGDWIDLRVDTILKHNSEECNLPRDLVTTIEYKKGDILFLGLGVAMELPKDHEAYVVPRSSTFDNTGFLLTNGIGIIDNSYSGDGDEWKAMVYCTRDGVIEKHDRLFQFRIAKKMDNIRLEEVERLDNKDRGGYGSTGLK